MWYFKSLITAIRYNVKLFKEQEIIKLKIKKLTINNNKSDIFDIASTLILILRMRKIIQFTRMIIKKIKQCNS